MQTTPQAKQATPGPLWQKYLQCAAEDLTDPVIRADAERLELERQVVVKRLAPHIEEIVQLAWRQLQQDQASGSSNRSRP